MTLTKKKRQCIFIAMVAIITAILINAATGIIKSETLILSVKLPIGILIAGIICTWLYHTIPLVWRCMINLVITPTKSFIQKITKRK